MNKVSEETLYELYVIRQEPMHQISTELGIAIGSVYNYLKKYKIPTRNHKDVFTFKGRTHSKEARELLSSINKGRIFSDETRRKISDSKKIGGIGHKKNRSDGYVSIYFPDHPRANSDGYIMEHDLIMECLIGRRLYDNECVHHINEEKSDNRKENLMLMTKSEHMSYHSKKRWEQKKGGMTY